MGLRDDLERFREIGDQRRQDLSEFIRTGDLRAGEDIRVPVKIVDLPEFEYDQREMGGVGQGDGDTPEEGDPVGQPEDADGDGEEGDPGEEAGEHEYYEMDPEEFAQELDEELGLDLEPKGKQVVEEVEGDFTELTQAGPNSTLDFERLFKSGLKRKLATDVDDEYVREACTVADATARETFEFLREEANLVVSMATVEEHHEDVADERGRYADFEAFAAENEPEPAVERIRRKGLDQIPFRREDERYRHPETIEKREKNVVVVNIRDVSGSMRQEKRELVERTFTPLDWYLTGKYDRAEFRYVAHDAEAWEVDRQQFFGIQSGGGTKISSAYELAAELLEEYPFSEWNRYVLAAGDSENSSNDTTENVVPLMEELDANLHAYVETQPGGGAINATHADEVEASFGETDDVAVARVGSPEDVPEAIRTILTTESED
ncbi:MAG: YeaH/YhbH family protein [Halolamina sp.]